MDNKPSKHPERRQNFRLEYPPFARPMSVIQGKEFPVLDISERGLKVKTALSMDFVEGKEVAMTVQLVDESLDLAGRVVHVQDSCVGILLSEAIPLATLRAVERDLREKHYIGSDLFGQGIDENSLDNPKEVGMATKPRQSARPRDSKRVTV